MTKKPPKPKKQKPRDKPVNMNGLTLEEALKKMLNTKKPKKKNG